jgi:hypothetical protein
VGVGAAMALEPDDSDEAAMEAELSRLKQEHRDLDAAIDALENVVAGDQLQIQRLKKRKLILKDRMSYLEDELTPDIIA